MSKSKNPRRGEGMNARAPLTSLTRSHAQRGWGGFDRCMTYAMQGLAVCLPSKSAEGRTTAYQVAIASHITDRWAREGLKRLEKAGLISWERGGIGPDGCPRPSWIRVDKRAYLAWINLREWVKRKKDNAVARYRAYRERVSKIEHAPQPPEAQPAPVAMDAAQPAPVAEPSRPCERVYTPEQVSEIKDDLRRRGYDSDQISRMMARPVPGWDGWALGREFDALVREFEADHGYGSLADVEVDVARDPEGRLIKRFAK